MSDLPELSEIQKVDKNKYNALITPAPTFNTATMRKRRQRKLKKNKNKNKNKTYHQEGISYQNRIFNDGREFYRKALEGNVETMPQFLDRLSQDMGMSQGIEIGAGSYNKLYKLINSNSNVQSDMAIRISKRGIGLFNKSTWKLSLFKKYCNSKTKMSIRRQLRSVFYKHKPILLWEKLKNESLAISEISDSVTTNEIQEIIKFLRDIAFGIQSYGNWEDSLLFDTKSSYNLVWVNNTLKTVIIMPLGHMDVAACIKKLKKHKLLILGKEGTDCEFSPNGDAYNELDKLWKDTQKEPWDGKGVWQVGPKEKRFIHKLWYKNTDVHISAFEVLISIRMDQAFVNLVVKRDLSCFDIKPHNCIIIFDFGEDGCTIVDVKVFIIDLDGDYCDKNPISTTSWIADKPIIQENHLNMARIFMANQMFYLVKRNIYCIKMDSLVKQEMDIKDRDKNTSEEAWYQMVESEVDLVNISAPDAAVEILCSNKPSIWLKFWMHYMGRHWGGDLALLDPVLKEDCKILFKILMMNSFYLNPIDMFATDDFMRKKALAKRNMVTMNRLKVKTENSVMFRIMSSFINAAQKLSNKLLGAVEVENYINSVVTDQDGSKYRPPMKYYLDAINSVSGSESYSESSSEAIVTTSHSSSEYEGGQKGGNPLDVFNNKKFREEVGMTTWGGSARMVTALLAGEMPIDIPFPGRTSSNEVVPGSIASRVKANRVARKRANNEKLKIRMALRPKNINNPNEYLSYLVQPDMAAEEKKQDVVMELEGGRKKKRKTIKLLKRKTGKKKTRRKKRKTKRTSK
tara:strand:+ start:312 stop:2705 length:2394 start_codon:yes stop_codon:yes gene_type:complete